MGTSKMRGRLSRATEAAPVETRRDRDAPGRERGGVTRRLRPGTANDPGESSRRTHEGRSISQTLRPSSGQRPDRGRRSEPAPGPLGVSKLFGAAGAAAASGARSRPASEEDLQSQAGLQTAARGAAGKAGSAFTGAAGMAARAGQSAASATRDASTMLAHRMSDVSTRMADRSDRMSDQSAADLGWAASRLGDRPRHDRDRERERERSSDRERSSGRNRDRSWDEPRDRMSSWETPDQRSWGESEGRRMGRIGRRRERSREMSVPGDEASGRAADRLGRVSIRDRQAEEEGRRGRPAWEGGQRQEWQRPDQPSGHGRRARRRDEQGVRLRADERAAREQGDQRRWDLPEGLSWDDLGGGQGRVHGVSKRQQRRIEKAQCAADETTQRAFEASERAMRHSRSRRARRSEQKATMQADRAQRLLEQHLVRAERRMTRSHQRRRRGMGMVLLVGAGAGVAIATRRYLGQPGLGQPAGSREEQAGQRPMPTTAGGFTGTDRLSERMASETASGRIDRMEEMPGVDTMSDPSASRRF